MDIISTAVFTGYQKMLIISHPGLDNEFLIGYFFEIYMLIISHNIIRDMVFISSVHFRILLYQNRTLIKLRSWHKFS